MTSTSQQNRSQIDLEFLESFVTENEGLLELERRVGRFNLFDALGIVRDELKHSNFLAWLLNPSASHGQGDLFLKGVVLDLLRKARQQGLPLPVSPVEVDGERLDDAEVLRERPCRLDLCIVSKAPSFVVAIENKVDASEHGKQLAKYIEGVCTAYPEQRALFVFLTRRGDDPTDLRWLPYTYAELYQVLTRVQRTAKGSLGGDVGAFLDHYLSLIRSQFMEDPSIAELCRRIYANHKRAIELINEHAPVAGSEAIEVIRHWLEKSPPKWLIRSQSRGYMSFVPRAWVGVVVDAEGSRLESAACEAFVECRSWGDEQSYLAVRLVIGRAPEPSQRLRVIERLKAAPYLLSMQRKEPSPIWTRLASKTLASWPTDEEVPGERIEEALGNWLSSVCLALESMPQVLKDAAKGP
jgi:hypothetical protein